MKLKNLRTTEQPKSLDVAKAVKAILRRQKKLDAKPATDGQLSQIWPPWYALADDMLPGEKWRILTLDQNSPHDHNSAYFSSFQKLRQQFDYLPFDRHEYKKALNQACRWSMLIQFVQSTERLHNKLVASQWLFTDADKHAVGRVAISRATKEIRLRAMSCAACSSVVSAEKPRSTSLTPLAGDVFWFGLAVGGTPNVSDVVPPLTVSPFSLSKA